jgi:hypothetical protein
MFTICAIKSIRPGIVLGLCDLKRKGNISKMLLPGIDVWLMKMIPSEINFKNINFF